MCVYLCARVFVTFGETVLPSLINSVASATTTNN